MRSSTKTTPPLSLLRVFLNTTAASSRPQQKWWWWCAQKKKAKQASFYAMMMMMMMMKLVYIIDCCYTRSLSERRQNISRFFFKRNVTLNIIDKKLELDPKRRRPRIKGQKKRSLLCFGFIHSFFVCVCVSSSSSLSHHYISEEDVEYLTSKKHENNTT